MSDRTGPTREAEENKSRMLDTAKPEIVLVHARLVESSNHWPTDDLVQLLEYRTESVLVFD